MPQLIENRDAALQQRLPSRLFPSVAMPFTLFVWINEIMVPGSTH